MIKILQHLCPCCSQPLLRHISCQRVYWFCSQCHQEMPDLENLLKAQVPQHWASKQRIVRKPLNKALQKSDKLYFCMKDNKELQHLAFSDSLTKVANRLRFQAYLDQQWQRMAQEQAPLSLILGDLDFFKSYNDIYGRQEGDKCLQQVAQVIASTINGSADLVPRYGGEEFVVILPQTKAQGAYRVAQEIIAKTKSLKIPHLNSPISPYVTLSLGVASIIPSDDYSAELLICAAEQALYQAKAQGRDRLILHENLLQQITISQPKPILLLQGNSAEKNDQATQNDELMSYVAYYLSRGKSIISPLKGSISFAGLVYAYWGYQKQFEDFWQQLQQRRDFFDLYIDGDVYCFGQFLKGSCVLGECTRCNLPTPKTIGRAPDVSNCTLCLEPSDDSKASNLEELPNAHIVAIGIPATDSQKLQELFFRNGIEVTFIPKLEDISQQVLPATVNMVIIVSEISQAEGNAWAEALSSYEQFSGVPIIALSPEAGHGMPYMERNLGITDYILTPHNGDRLASHLREIIPAQSLTTTTELHWFPR